MAIGNNEMAIGHNEMAIGNNEMAIGNNEMVISHNEMAISNNEITQKSFHLKTVMPIVTHYFAMAKAFLSVDLRVEK
jgi:hypothetical protein